MHILHVHARVKPDCIEAFKTATIDNARNTRREPGVVRFDVIQQTDDPTRFVLLEVYRTAEGHARHKETSHYLAWTEKVTDLLAEPRTRAIYRNIDPPDGEW